ncbi:MAG: GTP-binding protein YchF [Candidatus Gottesmanbacteria bacterium GW2011_GWA2_43_14]|uniref:Ribosome-binding ATPase YchF n=1 Tax=Candidatus Gottesmanbacteria bacterium GW2011_GWA2_43_14 TaxID=1618443 RepID=A0A0G1DFP1_9BACT|nr:MAG: GTP-binding protein YchF [Candidatus Gottesmanbacteria bacterium GW2011_GWA2_43_14]
MNLSVGIVGLPNVGKSTLFNALLKRQIAEAANYPFCTIEPNVGVVEVPDDRLSVLAKIVQTEKIIPAIVEFYDIAGLVKDAAKGAGLGNKFLAHIREVNAIIHVVRLFEDPNVVHVTDKVDPAEDIETVRTELALADLATLEKQPEPRMNATREQRAAWLVIDKAKKLINQGKYGLAVELTTEEQDDLRHLNLLSVKPVLYLFNISEKQLEKTAETEKVIKDTLNKLKIDAPYLYFCAKLENEVLALSGEEQREYLRQYGLGEIGLNRLIKSAYGLLGLISFLTAGEKEVRAWTILNNTQAVDAAGVIHTDFSKNFIKADIIPYDEFVESGGWASARVKGLVESVGREYLMKDGLVVEFKIGT